MATQKVMFSSSDFKYYIGTTFDNSELMLSINPKDFILRVHQETASKLADKILDRLSPAINKALLDLTLEKEELD